MVAIGGGTGLSTLLGGLKPFLDPAATAKPSISLTAIVTVTDDGKSSGRLRSEFGVIPPGDIRNCLVALADEVNLLTRLFRHRFPGDHSVGGHSLGNLVIVALSQMNGDFLAAVDQAGQLLGVRARVLPSTLERVDLAAQIHGRLIRGQVAIKSQPGPIRNLSLTPPFARALPAAIQAIREADLITLGPGSLFTSVIASLLVREIGQALTQSPAKKIYICNAMTEFDETEGFSAVDHVRQLLAYAPELRLDYALFNSAPISTQMRVRYAIEKAVALEPPSSKPLELAESADLTELEAIKFISLPLASESRFVRHDPDRLSRAIFEIYSQASAPQ